MWLGIWSVATIRIGFWTWIWSTRHWIGAGNWIGALTLSLLSNLPSKNGAFIRSVKFLFPEVALYLYKSNIWPCMEYCFHAWAVTPSSYLELLDKLQKWICRTIGPSLTASLESLTHRQNVASLNILYSYRAGKIRWHSCCAPAVHLK